MNVFSGKVKLATCGVSTTHRDVKGQPLSTGDIVVIYTDGYVADGLTVVMQNMGNAWEEGNPPFSVMGIASIPLDDLGNWRVQKVKDHSCVLDGENWPYFGFSYSNSEELT